MKHLFLSLFLFTITLSFISCGNSSSSSNEAVDSLKNIVSKQEAQIKALKDTIDMLKFPADQRFAKAIECLANNNLDEAEKLFNEIKRLFPLSEEAKQCDAQIQKIAEKRQELKAEQERIKAMGFKALSPVTNATIDDVNIVLSAFSTGKEFVHDTYSTYGSSEWRYNSADKGNKFITCAMTVTSESSDPKLPTLAFYSVKGDKLSHEGDFKIEFARWDDLGTYLGNEPDLHNDFAKVNTIKFKLGCEVSEALLNKPYIVVLKMKNTQERNYDRFNEPPVWYDGDADYPLSLTIEDFNGKYKAVKIANL